MTVVQVFSYGPPVSVPVKTVGVTATPSRETLQLGESISVSWDLHGYSQVGLTDWELSVGLTSPSDPEDYWICSADFVRPAETGSHTITIDEDCFNQLTGKQGPWYPTIVVSNYDQGSIYPFELVGFGNPVVIAVLDEAVPTPSAITVPPADSDGNYIVKWGAAAAAGADYVVQEATDPSFTSGVRTFAPTTSLTKSISGRSQKQTYYYRIRARKAGYTDSDWLSGSNGCAVPGTAKVMPPGGIAVPAKNASGAYPVTWGASKTTAATYVLEEATSPTFSSRLRVAYVGTASVADITERTQDTTYYYRVRAVKAGLRDSAKQSGGNGCAVPGESQLAMPASITVPAADPDGSYTVTWEAAAPQESDVSYVLEEASNPAFTAGHKVVYAGTGFSKVLKERALNKTYYYRVKAVKAGWQESNYRTGGRGCAVPGTTKVATPKNISIPLSDADGSFTVNWKKSATTGASYVLEEASSPDFSTDWQIAYFGNSLSETLGARPEDTTYYYRVKAVKAGAKDSSYLFGAYGCTVYEEFSGGTPVERVSIATDGTESNFHSWMGYSSSAGRRVVFHAGGTNLFDGAPSGSLLMRDRLTAQTTLVSSDAIGMPAELGGQQPAISRNGRFAAFSSFASNLVPGDTNETADVFLKDLKTDAIELISKSSDEIQGNEGSFAPAISNDGRYVAFVSMAANFYPDDSASSWDIFIRDRQTGQTEHVGAGGDFDDGPAISGEGRQVIYPSSGQIIVYDRQSGVSTNASVTSGGIPGNGASEQPCVSEDGRYVTFTSLASNLVADDTNGARDVFVRDRQGGTIKRVSVHSNGAQGNASVPDFERPGLSGDGRFVAFTSAASNLVDGDTSGFTDVFMHDMSTGETRRVNVSAAGIEANGASGDNVLVSMSADGKYVVFSSMASNLVAEDANSYGDVFVVPNPFLQ